MQVNWCDNLGMVSTWRKPKRALAAAVVAPLALSVLSACSRATDDTPVGSPEVTVAGADPVRRFLSCLQLGGVEARTLERVEFSSFQEDMVFIRDPVDNVIDADGHIQGKPSTFSKAIIMSTISDQPEIRWVAVASGTDLVEDPALSEIYQSCEAQVPEFVQPPPIILTEDPDFIAAQQREYEDALEFARCARDSGFPQFADPPVPFRASSTIMQLPQGGGITPELFRILLEACWEDDYGFGWAFPPDSPYLDVLTPFWARRQQSS